MESCYTGTNDARATMKYRIFEARATAPTVSASSVAIRPAQVGDLPILFEFQTDAEATHLAAFAPPDPLDREAHLTKWTRLLADPSIIRRTLLLDQEQIVGSVGSCMMEGERQVTYWIDRSRWRQGLATTALRLLLDEVKARPIYARAAFDNLGSKRVLEKCGFAVHAHDRGFANARSAKIAEVVFKLS
jgi:[ribosomal protein S5]-alanine N-acetyltransferase